MPRIEIDETSSDESEPEAPQGEDAREQTSSVRTEEVRAGPALSRGTPGSPAGLRGTSLGGGNPGRPADVRRARTRPGRGVQETERLAKLEEERRMKARKEKEAKAIHDSDADSDYSPSDMQRNLTSERVSLKKRKGKGKVPASPPGAFDIKTDVPAPPVRATSTWDLPPSVGSDKVDLRVSEEVLYMRKDDEGYLLPAAVWSFLPMHGIASDVNPKFMTVSLALYVYGPHDLTVIRSVNASDAQGRAICVSIVVSAGIALSRPARRTLQRQRTQAAWSVISLTLNA